MKYYLTLSNNIRGNGISLDDTLPKGAVECTQAQYEDSGKWTVSSGSVVAYAPSLSDAKAAQNELIISAAQDALEQVSMSYPELDLQTFPLQLAEASAYTANNSSETPMLAAISTALGETVSDLAAIVMEKAPAYQAELGAIIGKRAKLMSQVSKATTISAMKKIIW